MLLPDYLRPGLRVVIAGVMPLGPWDGERRYYAGRGNAFWYLLRESGLVDDVLEPGDDERLPERGIGLTDLVKTVTCEPHNGGPPANRSGGPPACGGVAGGGVRVDYDSAGLAAKIAWVAPTAVAFVSKTAAHAYAQGAGLARPQQYGETPWPVGGRPGFVLPGPSGANNAMPLPLRIALWRDLADFLDTQPPSPTV